jgi:hypothetical protein
VGNGIYEGSVVVPESTLPHYDDDNNNNHNIAHIVLAITGHKTELKKCLLPCSAYSIFQDSPNLSGACRTYPDASVRYIRHRHSPSRARSPSIVYNPL